MTTSQTSLKQRTIDGLAKARGQFPVISQEAEVSHSWISKLVNGSLPSPSADRIERVYRSLVRRGLVAPEVRFDDAA